MSDIKPLEAKITNCLTYTGTQPNAKEIIIDAVPVEDVRSAVQGLIEDIHQRDLNECCNCWICTSFLIEKHFGKSFMRPQESPTQLSRKGSSV